MKGDGLLGFAVGGVGRGDEQGRDVIGLKANVHVKQAIEAFAEQSGNDEKNHGGG